MEELFNILSEGKAHVRVEMDATDLKAFSDELIRRKWMPQTSRHFPMN